MTGLRDWSPFDKVRAMLSPRSALRRAGALAAAGKRGAAFRIYVRAARKSTEAEYRVGRSYLEGLGVPANRNEAVQWLERAGSHGHVEAQSMLYLEGVTAPRTADVGAN